MTDSQIDGVLQAIRAMCYDSGRLVSVRYGSYSELPDRAYLIGLAFESGHWWLAVDPDDDSLAISEGLPDDQAVLTQAPQDSPWLRAVGMRPRWIWTMTNQQGYLDGIQFEFFGDDADDVQIQMMAVASAWWISLLP